MMYIITRDGKPVAETDEPMAWFHRHVPYSMDHALKHEGYRVEPAESYPRKTEDGRTVWACCVSSIGPACQHKTERYELVQLDLIAAPLAAYAVIVDGAVIGHVRKGIPQGTQHGWVYSPGLHGLSWLGEYPTRDAAAARLVKLYG